MACCRLWQIYGRFVAGLIVYNREHVEFRMFVRGRPRNISLGAPFDALFSATSSSAISFHGEPGVCEPSRGSVTCARRTESVTLARRFGSVTRAPIERTR